MPLSISYADGQSLPKLSFDALLKLHEVVQYNVIIVSAGDI